MSRRTSAPEPHKLRVRQTRNGEDRAPLRPLDVGILPNLLGYNVRRAHMALWRDFNRTVGAAHIRPGIFSMMVLIDANPGVAQIELASQLAIDKATLVGLIRQLQRLGWLERRSSSTDRRRQDLFLTTLGRQQLVILKRVMIEHERRFLNVFTRKELTEFFEYLRRIQI
ncbi:MAG TPA: MarR family winged helix-turn-helix transcriptional regulator [Steroidobacteraceae bacterium]|nr:MarR family winged helix-turn-helix transcriptional regulator [Steroidobacteraceae bacterium]